MNFLKGIISLVLFLIASFTDAQSSTSVPDLKGEWWAYERFCTTKEDTIVEMNAKPFATITFGSATTFTLNYNVNYNDPKKEEQNKAQTGNYEVLKNKKPQNISIRFASEHDKFPFLNDIAEKNNYGLIITSSKTCFLRFVKEN